MLIIMSPFLKRFWLLIIIITCCGGQVSGNNKLPSGNDVESYDFIVVGGGLSGCVVTGRLSEKYSVLLVNDGGRPGDELDIPATMFSLIGNPNYTKVYKSIPQATAGLSNTNAQIDYTIGRVLGGGSSVNAMIYNRGSPHDYNNWAKVANDSSWEYNNLLKYFKRMEDYKGKFPSDEHHGKGGPITISVAKNYAPGQEEWMEAGEFMGYSSRKDPNGPQAPGFVPMEFTQHRGRRISAYTGYVKPFLKTRSNLKVVTEAEVKRILFNEENDRAIGVSYTKRNGDGALETIRVMARKEVIISAGTIDSPAILMKSGIGPLDVLERSKIPAVKVLPVGYNLQDHVILKMEAFVDKEKSDLLIPERDLTPESWELFEKTGDGPYSSLLGFHGQAFIVSSVRKQEEMPNPDWADFQLIQMQTSGKVGTIPEAKENKEDTVTISTLIYFGRPKSRGRVTLNSSDVDAMPIVDFNFLSHPDDVTILVEAVKLVVKLYETAPSFQKQGAKYSQVPYESCNHLQFRSDEYWRCFITYIGVSALHAGGTCRMGAVENEPTAVVDSKLNVIGIEGLRVVDLSVIPNITNTNTQAAAYVIAEKASAMILNKWSASTESDDKTGTIRPVDEL